MFVLTPPVGQHIGIQKINMFQHLILGETEREREREVFYILCPLDVPGQTDGCQWVPIGFFCR